MVWMKECICIVVKRRLSVGSVARSAYTSRGITVYMSVVSQLRGASSPWTGTIDQLQDSQLASFITGTHTQCYYKSLLSGLMQLHS